VWSSTATAKGVGEIAEVSRKDYAKAERHTVSVTCRVNIKFTSLSANIISIERSKFKGELIMENKKCNKCKNPVYLMALSVAQTNQQKCFERCKKIVTNPIVLQAIAAPITQLRKCPVNNCLK
jgi:hypothetical protein